VDRNGRAARHGDGRRSETRPPKSGNVQPAPPPELARYVGRGPVAELSMSGRIAEREQRRGGDHPAPRPFKHRK
jgi:hypothetical protein